MREALIAGMETENVDKCLVTLRARSVGELCSVAHQVGRPRQVG